MKKSIFFAVAVFTVFALINPVISATQADPYRGYRFQIMIDGKPAMAFNDVSGYDMNSNVAEYREGNSTVTPKKLPGIKKYGNVTLKKGIVNPTLASGWIDSASAAKTIVRKKLTINLLDENGKIAASWDLINALPLKSVKSEKENSSGFTVYESIEFAHEGINRTK